MSDVQDDLIAADEDPAAGGGDAAAKPKAGKIKLLGLEGDVTMLIDPVRRIPLEVSGRVQYLGRVTIRLLEAVLDGDATPTR